MLFSQDFFDLNLKFARRVAEVTGESLQQSLLEYTHLYLAFGLGRDFDPENPIWQDFLCQIMERTDPAEYTHRFYSGRMAEQPKQLPDHSFGCFSYALWERNRVRLHFRSARDEPGVLHKDKVPGRVAELKALFGHLRRIVPITSTVIGGSWLYNIEAYHRLFPANFLHSAQGGHNECRFISLWGQFLCYDGRGRQPIAEIFLERLKAQRTLQGLKDCFLYPVLRLQSSIKDFFTYYGVESVI
jgi:hypothetical protein